MTCIALFNSGTILSSKDPYYPLLLSEALRSLGCKSLAQRHGAGKWSKIKIQTYLFPNPTFSCPIILPEARDSTLPQEKHVFPSTSSHWPHRAFSMLKGSFRHPQHSKCQGICTFKDMFQSPGAKFPTASIREQSQFTDAWCSQGQLYCFICGKSGKWWNIEKYFQSHMNQKVNTMGVEVVGGEAKKQLRSICGTRENRLRCLLKETMVMNFRASRPCQHS